jgi:hypothetical protein
MTHEATGVHHAAWQRGGLAARIGRMGAASHREKTDCQHHPQTSSHELGDVCATRAGRLRGDLAGLPSA